MTKSKIDMAWCTISSLSIFCETNLEPELRTRLIQKHWNTEGRQCHRDDGGISGGDCLEPWCGLLARFVQCQLEESPSQSPALLQL